jgi:hypothetical protein
MANLSNPTAFGDFRKAEKDERKRLDDRQQQLLAIKAKRGGVLSKELQEELDEIQAKLGAEDIVDPLFKAAQNNLRLLGTSVADHVEGIFDPFEEPAKQLAAVIGIVAADAVPPPKYHLDGVTPPFDPGDEQRRQKFGKAVAAAQGEYVTSFTLFDAVLPILKKVGRKRLADEVKAIEWAQVVRYLLEHGVSDPSREPQLGRRVDEALDSIQNVGEDRPPSDINIDLPDLETTTNTEIIKDNIRALQPAYFAAMFEELKAFRVVDKLVELFQNGILPISRGDAADGLFKYWKETATRVSESERRSHYARTLGTVGGDEVGMPNREFNELFMRFVSAVREVVRQNTVDQLLTATRPAAINQQQVRQSGRDLAYNLSLHGFGIAHCMATELQKQVKDVLGLLSHPDILGAYGAKDPWQVIDQVAATELDGAKNSVKYRTMAASGAIIIAWLSDHTQDLLAPYGLILDMDEIRNPSPRPSGYKPTLHPTDFDLVNACEQWLAVTGTQDEQVETYAQPKEAANMTSKPIQIPAIARDMLESVGMPMGLGGGGNGRDRARYQ